KYEAKEHSTNSSLQIAVLPTCSIEFVRLYNTSPALSLTLYASGSLLYFKSDTSNRLLWILFIRRTGIPKALSSRLVDTPYCTDFKYPPIGPNSHSFGICPIGVCW